LVAARPPIVLYIPIPNNNDRNNRLGVRFLQPPVTSLKNNDAGNVLNFDHKNLTLFLHKHRTMSLIAHRINLMPFIEVYSRFKYISLI
jgi:hypothetical protein